MGDMTGLGGDMTGYGGDITGYDGDMTGYGGDMTGYVGDMNPAMSGSCLHPISPYASDLAVPELSSS